MDPVSVVESRLNQLEVNLGYPPDVDVEKSVTEQVTTIESILENITSGRDKIADINKHIEDLNCFLDPQYINRVDDSRAKCNYVLANEPNIRFHCKNMELCKEKIPILDSDVMAEIPKHNVILNEIKEKNIENKDHSDQAEKCIQQMMETCHQVSLTIMENLVAINKKIDILEKTNSK